MKRKKKSKKVRCVGKENINEQHNTNQKKENELAKFIEGMASLEGDLLFKLTMGLACAYFLKKIKK